jgi:hypothetical protein
MEKIIYHVLIKTSTGEVTYHLEAQTLEELFEAINKIQKFEDRGL